MLQMTHVLSQVNDPLVIGILIVVLVVVFVLGLILLKFARLWLQAYFSRADVRLSELIGMWLRRVDARTIVQSKITAVQASLAERRLTRILLQIAADRPAEHFPNNSDFSLDGRAAVVHAFIQCVRSSRIVRLFVQLGFAESS